jgi:hypothetical protein
MVSCFSDQLTDEVIFYLIGTENSTFLELKVAKIHEICQNANCILKTYKFYSFAPKDAFCAVANRLDTYF